MTLDAAFGPCNAAPMPEPTGPAWTVQFVRDRARRKREAENLTLRDVGEAIGVAASSVLRFEGGKMLAADHFLAIAEWAGFRLTAVK